MKIFIDINHPALVHFYRGFIKIMEAKGHRFIVVNRDDDLINYLLDYYHIKHIIRNKRPVKRHTLLSALYLLILTYWHFKLSFKYKPDIYLGAYLMVPHIFKKPSIMITDTEHNNTAISMHKPYADVILTPYNFYKDLGKKQIRFNAYTQQTYLRSNCFKDCTSIFSELGIEENEPYILFRFVAYNANHDKYVVPIDLEKKKQFVKEAEKRMKVFVSLECPIEDEFLNNHLIHIAPELMHAAIKYAALFVTEGATMASEAGLLGTKYIYINPLQNIGYIQEQVKTIPQIANSTIDISEINHIIANFTIIDKKEKEKCSYELESKTIDPTQLLVWFVENYPDCKEIMKNNSEYQNRFI